MPDSADDEAHTADAASKCTVPILSVAGKLDDEKEVFKDCEASQDDCNLEEDCYDSNDPDVAHFAKLPPEEMLATLERMIGASTDTDDLSTSQPSQEDTLARLQEECTAMRDEVQEQARAKADLESRLREDMRKLQERCASQLAEKASLTQRLQDAKAVWNEKLEHMRSINANLQHRIEEEKQAKEVLRVKLAENLQAMMDKVTLLNRRIQDDWENQVSLVKELDAETNSQSHYQSELHAEREKSWRQSHDVMEAFASSKAAQPLALEADVGWRTRYHSRTPSVQEIPDHAHDDLRRAIKSHEAMAIREKEEHTDVVKQLALEIWNKRNDTESLKKKLTVEEKQMDTLLKRMEEMKSNPSMARAINDRSLDGSHPPSPSSACGSNSEHALALGKIEELGRTMRDVEAFKSELVELQQTHAQRWHLMERSKQMDREQIADLKEDLQKRQASKIAKMAELEQERKQEELLQGELQELVTQKEYHENVQQLQAELRAKKDELECLRGQNEGLEEELTGKQSCCRPSRAKYAKPQQPMAPSNDAQSSRQQPRPAAAPAPAGAPLRGGASSAARPRNPGSTSGQPAASSGSRDGGTPAAGAASSSSSRPAPRGGGSGGQPRQGADAKPFVESAGDAARSSKAPRAEAQPMKAASSSSGAASSTAPPRALREEPPNPALDSSTLTSKPAASSDRWPVGPQGSSGQLGPGFAPGSGIPRSPRPQPSPVIQSDDI